jgi:cytochrome c-type biogenesis protein CcmH
MRSEIRRMAGWGIAIAATVVMVIGLLPGESSADPEQRAVGLEQRLACPLCQGQSLAESDSQVAEDLKVILRDKVDEGMTDTQIFDFFASRYGGHIVLEPPLLGWGIALWATPLLALGVGGWVVWTRQRRVS